MFAIADDELMRVFYDTTYSYLDLSTLRISYGNNVNVGVGEVVISSYDSRFVGKRTINFKILPYQIDIGYESNVDESAFGIDGVGGTPLSATDHLTNLILNNEIGKIKRINWLKEHA